MLCHEQCLSMTMQMQLDFFYGVFLLYVITLNESVVCANWTFISIQKNNAASARPLPDRPLVQHRIRSCQVLRPSRL